MGAERSPVGVQWAEWLDKTFPHSQGIRRVEEGNLFFPEEMPDVIAEEATRLWKTEPQAERALHNEDRPRVPIRAASLGRR